MHVTKIVQFDWSAVFESFCYKIRVSTSPGNPGNLLEFKNPPGNPGNVLGFNWSSWKFLCKVSKIDHIGFQS